MAVCRITGHSRGLPRPNYFPLLPPISPGEARRCCRITGKSYGLPSHHYIPVLLARPAADRARCRITTAAEGLPAHAGAAPATKHVITSDYRYVFPYFDESEETLKPLLTLLENKNGLSDSKDRYVYRVDERKCQLVLTAALEAAVRDGDVRDVQLARNSDKVLLKLKAGRHVTVPVKDFDLNDEWTLWDGEGPSERVLQEKTLAVKRKRNDGLSSMTRIFEEKDKAVDLEEERVAQIEAKKAKRIERTKIKENGTKKKIENDKIKSDITKIEIPKEEIKETIQLEEEIINIHKHTRAEGFLVMCSGDWRDLVKPLIESWDWETFEREAAACMGHPIVSEIPKPIALKADLIDLSTSLPGLVQQPTITEVGGLPVIEAITPITPLIAQPNSDIQIALQELTPHDLNKTLDKGESILEIRKELPTTEEITKITEKLSEGSPTTLGNLHGLSIDIEAAKRFIPGQSVETPAGNVFVPGQTLETPAGNIFMPGMIVNSSEGPLLIPGQNIVSPDSQTPIFVAGQTISTREGEKFVPGQTLHTAEGSRFVPGQTISTPNGPAFVAGQTLIEKDGTKRFVTGQTVLTPEGPSFVPGQTITNSNGEVIFIPGQVQNIENKFEFIPGQTVKTPEGEAVFVPGQTVITSEGPKFIPGQSIINEQGSQFVPGVSQVDSNGDLKFIPGRTIQTPEGPRFLEGHLIESEKGRMFAPGKITEKGFTIASSSSELKMSSVLPEGLTITSASGAVFGNMVQTQNGVQFFPGAASDGLPAGKIVPGQLVPGQGGPKFVPGVISDGNFVPGQVVLTDAGEQFVPGQVIETRDGAKFVPGQIVESRTGPKFVPGQTVQTAEGPRFVPGQIVDTRVGPTFVPGQVISTEKEGCRFVPGQVVDTVEGPRFVPGRLVETNDGVSFVPGQVVQTEDGLRFVATDLEDTPGGGFQFSVQAFELTPEELQLLKPITAAVGGSAPIDSRLMRQLSEAGMAVGRQIPAELPIVEVKPVPVLREAQNLAEKVGLEKDMVVPLAEVLNHFASLGEQVKLQPSCVEFFKKESHGNLEELIKAVVAAVAVAPVKDQEGILATVSSVLSDVLKDIQELQPGGASASVLVDSLRNYLNETQYFKQLSHTKSKVELIKAFTSEKDPNEREARLSELLKPEQTARDNTMGAAFKALVQAEPSLISAVVEKVSEGVTKISSEKEATISLQQAIVEVVKESTDKHVKDLEDRSLREAVLQAIGLARALGIREAVHELLEILNNPSRLEALASDAESKKILRRLVLMRQLSEQRPGFRQALGQLQSDPELARTDPRLRELVRESAALMVVPEEVIENSAQVPNALFLTGNSLAMEDFLAQKIVTSGTVLILKHGLQAVVPREAARAVLTGQVAYTVLDEQGVRHFEPMHVFSALGLPRPATHRFSMYACPVLEDHTVTTVTPASSMEDLHTFRGSPGYLASGENTPSLAKRSSSGALVNSSSVFSQEATPTRTLTDEGSEGYIVLRDFSSDESDALSVRQGELVEVIDFLEAAKWVVRSMEDPSRQGWVPAQILEKFNPDDSPRISEDNIGSDAAGFRREAVVRELVETEEEFGRDLLSVVDRYIRPLDSSLVPRVVRDNIDLVFSNLRQIAQFHNTVLIEGVKYYASEPRMIGKTFLRLERDFDKHVAYCRDEPLAQAFLRDNFQAREYFEEQSQILGDDKSLSEHLKLPIQRINDYQLLLKELVRYSSILGEDTTDLQRALELMQGVPHRADDIKFISNIEGYHGNIHKLGRLLRHDWFTVTDREGKSKERYLFLFKGKILICKVRRISEDRSVFILKDIVKLSESEYTDIKEDHRSFDLHIPGLSSSPLRVTAHSDELKSFWLKEIKQFASEYISSSDSLKTLPSTEFESISPIEALSNLESSKPISTLSEDTKKPESEKSVLQSIENIKSEEKVEQTIINKEEKVNTTENKDSKVTLETKRPLESEELKSESIQIKEIQKTEPPVKKIKAEETAEVKPPASVPLEKEKSIIAKKEEVKPSLENKESVVTLENKELITDQFLEKKEALESVGKAEVPSVNLEKENSIQTPVKPEEVKVTSVSSDKPKSQQISPKESPLKSEEIKVSSSTLDKATTETPEKVKVSSDTLVKENSQPIPVGPAKPEQVKSPIETKVNKENQPAAPVEQQKAISNPTPEQSCEPKTIETSFKMDPKANQEISSSSAFVMESSSSMHYESTMMSTSYEMTTEQQSVTTNVSSSDAQVFKLSLGTTSDGRPVFTKTIKGFQLEPGQNAIFECSLESEIPVDHMTWLKDNKPMEDRLADRVIPTRSGNDFKLEIMHCHELDTGIYTALATNPEGKATCTAQLIVQELSEEEKRRRAEANAPYFEVRLKDTELLENTYLRFMIKVRGNPNPKVTFLKDGKQIDETKEERIVIVRDKEEKGFYELVIADVHPIDAGLYACKATNKNGTNSCEAKVTVTDHKELFAGLNNQDSLPPGEEPSFQWLRDGQPFDPEERFKVLFRDEEDSLALVFQHVKPEDAGLYTCVASTSTGKISCSAELTVQGSINQLAREPEKPKVLTEATSCEVNIGGSAMMELKINGFPKPDIKWYHDGKEVTAGGRVRFLYEDEESMSLVIKGVTSEDAGKYKIVAKNDLGEDSVEMNLIVKAPPKIKTKMENRTCMAEEEVKMTIQVEGSPAPDVKWYKDGQQITASDRIKIIKESNDTYTLHLTKALLEDGGSYSVVASNELSQTTEMWSFTVNAPPKFTKTLQKTTDANENEKIILDVKIVGDPKPTVRWLKNGEEIKGDGKRVLLSQDGCQYVLTIQGSNRTDSGNYTVEATNVHGTARDEARLNIRCKPEFRTRLQDSQANEGDKNVEFMVNIEAYPKPNVKWYLGDVEITEKRTEYTRVEEGDNYKLVIKEVTTETKGKYSCKVVNDLGSTESSSMFTVNCKPRFPKPLKESVEIDEGQNLTLSVQCYAVPEPKVKWYKDGQEVSADARIKITRDSTSLENYDLTVTLVKGLDAGTYECRAENSMGTASSKSSVKVNTHTETADHIEDLKEEISEEIITEVILGNESVKPTIEDVQMKAEPHAGVEAQGIETNITVERFSCPDGKTVTISVASSMQQTASVTDDSPGLHTRMDSTRTRVILEESTPVIVEELETVSLKASHSLTNATIEEPISDLPKITKLSSGISIATLSEDEVPSLAEEPEEEEEDDVVEALLRRVQKQRSVLGEILEKEIQREAIPEIVKTDMNDRTIFESLGTKFEVNATGIPRPEAKWIKDGQEIKSSNRVRISDEGEKYRLEISDAKLEDAGVYQVKISNRLGEKSHEAKLSLTGESELRKPKVKSPLKNLKIPKNDEVILQCTINGDPIPDVTWSHDGQKLEASEALIMECESKPIEDGLNECTFTLKIPSGQHKDTGQYKIEATNKFGKDECSARLDILLKPELDGLKDSTITPYEDIEFEVLALANPKPKVSWIKDGKELPNNDHYKQTGDVQAEIYKLYISNIGLEDDGDYTFKASNEIGETTIGCHLNVHTEPPSFVKLLDPSYIIKDYEDTDMRIRVNGVPKAKIQWFKDGKELFTGDRITIETNSEGQVQSAISISHFNESDQGLYKCLASNLVGQAETIADLKMAQIPPSFGRPLDRAVEVDEGDTLDLKAKLDGSPIPTVTWYKDGEEIKPNGHIQLTANPDGSVRLLIEKCKPTDCGAYKLIATNPNGTSQAICAVAIKPNNRKPTFVKQLEDQKIISGQPLKLEATVMAYPAPEIKWFKDGHAVRPSKEVVFVNNPGGIIGLHIESARPEDAGTYTMKISNRLGDLEGTAKVQVEARERKPIFQAQLMPTTVVEGFPVKLEVKLLGHPQPAVNWFLGGKPVVPDGDRIKVVSQPDGTHCLLISKALPSDAGEVKVTANNSQGEVSCTTPLEVTPKGRGDAPEERPAFLHGLRDVHGEEGQPLTLSAPFIGNPIPEVTWSKDGVDLIPSDRIQMTCDGKKVGLEISPANLADAGIYSCKLSNPLGEDISEAKANVRKVYRAPEFSQKFTDLQQLPTYDAKFPARITGVPQPDVQWFYNGSPIGESDKYHVKRDGEACCLYIKDCKPEDSGRYKCVATNLDGKADCEANLEVVEKIGREHKSEAPYFLKRLGDCEVFKSMSAKFTACAAGTPEPEFEWFRGDDRLFPSERIKMDREGSGLLRLTILASDPADVGKYRLRIWNAHGEASCEGELTMDGLDVKPKRPLGDQYTDYDKFRKTGAPLPLADRPVISRMSDRRLTLSWKPSIPIGPRAPVTYRVEMCEQPDGEWFTARTGIRSCVCDIHNLEPFRDYKFRIRVENKYGVSDPSPFAITFREKLEPDPPKFVPYLQPGIDFRPETSPYFPKDYDVFKPPHDGYAQAPRFLRLENDTQYGVKNHNASLSWFVYGYPKPKMSYTFNDEPIEMAGRYDNSYTRNGQATLFINKMLDRDVGLYEAIAKNEHGEARQRVQLAIAEYPQFIRRPDELIVMLRKNGRIEARVHGVPYPEIKWYKDWQPLASSSRIKIQFIEPDTCILCINDAISKDEGLYSISARNVAGAISSSVMVRVEENDAEYGYLTYSRGRNIKPKSNKNLEDLYDLGDELGRGTQGVSYHAVERLTGRNYAAKVMHGKSDLKPFMLNELEALNSLNHKKIIRLQDAFETPRSVTLITELCDGGELLDVLTKQMYITESELAGYIRQLLWALEHMHNQNLAHLGLTPGDLLLAHPGGDDLKVVDFGLCRRITAGKLASLDYGMPEFVSPEIANKDGVSTSADMWAVGVITYLLLSGHSPFRGANDRETLTRVRDGKYELRDDWFAGVSAEARDFISKLMVYQPEGRMDVRTALQHPWLNFADKMPPGERQIPTDRLKQYYSELKDWYSNASCRLWYRRRPLSGADTHPSKMVYPPGHRYTPEPTPPPPPVDKTPREPRTWEDQVPSREPLDYEIGIIKSESHYQNGPDTYLLQLRDVDFPVRLREYMKVAKNRGPGFSKNILGQDYYDPRTPIIRERRRFTDVMDEEIDDERKERINQYGSADVYSLRRLRRELGTRLDGQAEAEALIETKRDGHAPFFREKPQMLPIVENQAGELVCLAVGEPKPSVQWFKNDMVVTESHRVKILEDEDGRSLLRFDPANPLDAGIYKAVARNKVGQTVARARVVHASIPGAPDSPEATEVSDTEVLLRWKQPKDDGHSPVVCYGLQYKAADALEWTEVANNIDHEFFLVHNLKEDKAYQFRLSARNRIGWSEKGIPTQLVKTQTPGAMKIQVSRAMRHLQQLTESGQEVCLYEPRVRMDYTAETTPIEWTTETAAVTEKYSFVSELSRGRYSVVAKGIEKATDRVIVAKILETSGEQEEAVTREFEALRSLRHERIASLLAAYRPPSSSVAVFIQEKLQGADILTYLSSRHEYSEQTVATVITQVLDALQYLHWRGYCHLDVQPDNVVMASVRSVQVKLVDFGGAYRVSKIGSVVPDDPRTAIEYQAPERLVGEQVFPQSDIWSVGALAYVLLSGVQPFAGPDENETRQNVIFVRYRFEHLYKELTQEATRFLMLVFKRTPCKRPTDEECHEHRWLVPSDFMIKKRERAVFLGNRLKEYSDNYHARQSDRATKSDIGGVLGGAKGHLVRSSSVQEELTTTM